MKPKIRSSAHQPSFCNSRMQVQLLKKRRITLIKCKNSFNVGGTTQQPEGIQGNPSERDEPSDAPGRVSDTVAWAQIMQRVSEFDLERDAGVPLPSVSFRDLAKIFEAARLQPPAIPASVLLFPEDTHEPRPLFPCLGYIDNPARCGRGPARNCYVSKDFMDDKARYCFCICQHHHTRHLRIGIQKWINASPNGPPKGP